MSVSFGSMALAIACSTGTAGPLVDPVAAAPAASEPAASTPAAPADAAPDRAPTACDLHANAVEFSSPACAACMQASCCASTVTCFVGAPDCAALYACMNACPSRGLEPDASTAGVEGGVRIDGGDAASPPDGGDSCVLTCIGQHPAQAAAAREYIRCYAGKCRTDCM